MIVTPAFNAAATLERTFLDIPPGMAEKIILIDKDALGARKLLPSQMGNDGEWFVYPSAWEGF